MESHIAGVLRSQPNHIRWAYEVGEYVKELLELLNAL